MRSRDEIFNDLDGIPTYVEHASKATSLCLEVLLDIREMLEKLANPIYTVEDVPMNFAEIVEKYMGAGGTSPGLTGVYRTPTGDIIKTTAETSPTGKYCDECGSYDHTTEEH